MSDQTPEVNNLYDPVEEQMPKTKRDVERDMIARYYLRFRKAETAVSTIHQTWAEIDKFDRGEQWKDQTMPPWVPKPITNYLRYIRQLKRANLASAIPSATFAPENVADQQIINMLQLSYDHVWQRKRVDRTVRRCIDRALAQGTAIAYVYSDDNYTGGKYYGSADPEDENFTPKAYDNQLFQGDICVKRWPNPNFFPDPDAYRIEDAKYIETTELVPMQWVQNNPTFKEYAGDLLNKLIGDQVEREDDASGTIFERDVNPVQNSFGNLAGDYMVTMHTHWERYLNEQGQWQLDVTYYVRNQDFALLRLEDVQPNEYPFAILYDEEEEQSFWGMSTLMDILPNQKVINKTSQTGSIIGTMHQNPQKIILRESGINAQDMARTGTLPGKVWVSNVPNAVETVKPPDIPRGLFDLEDRMKTDIREMAGVNEAYTGDNVGSLTTSTGVSDLIDRATVRDKDKLINVDEFVERISHLIVLFIINKWDMPRPLSVVGQDGQPVMGQNGQQPQFNPMDQLTKENLEWRVRSDIYAKAPSTQASRRQQAQQMIQTQGQFGAMFSIPLITPEEYIMMQDFDLKEQILQRMANDRQILQQQQQAQQDFAAKLGNGQYQVQLTSKDPSLILQTLEASQMQAQMQQQTNNQLQLIHTEQGMLPQQLQQGPLAQQVPPPGQQQQQPPQQGALPPGNTSPVAAQNMMQGR